MSRPLKTIRDRYTDEQIKAFYDAGFWASTSFNDIIREQARERGDRRFVFDSTTSLSFADYRDRSLRLAVGFKRAGITRGDRVAVQLPNWTDFPVVAAALSRIGAIMVPIMPIYRDDEVGYALEHSGAVVAVTCEEFRGFGHLDMFLRLRDHAPALTSVFVARASGKSDASDVHPLDNLLVEGDARGAGGGGRAGHARPTTASSSSTPRAPRRDPKGCFHTFNTYRGRAPSRSSRA